MAVKTDRVSVRPINGFDVVVERTIGHVDFGDGDIHPFVAAMGIIAEAELNDGDGGTYRFAAERGGETIVTIDYTEKTE